MRLPDIIYKISRKLGIADKPVLLEFPKKVDIGLTNFCNLECSFCPNSKIKKKRGFMEDSLFRSLVDCVADRFESKAIIDLGLSGESTLHPHFADFLKYASSRGVKTSISTNLVVLNEAISEALISTLNDIEISFYTLDKEKYNQIVGRDRYDQTLKNIHSFLTMAEKARFKGEVRLRPFSDFAEQADAFKKEFYQRYPGLDFRVQKPRIMTNWAGFLDIPKLLRGVYLQTPCLFPFSRIVVDWDGEARLCCPSLIAEDLTVGYVNKNYDLYDLWHSKKLDEIREKFSRIDYRDFSSCLKCYWSRRYFPLRKD